MWTKTETLGWVLGQIPDLEENVWMRLGDIITNGNEER